MPCMTARTAKITKNVLIVMLMLPELSAEAAKCRRPCQSSTAWASRRPTYQHPRSAVALVISKPTYRTICLRAWSVFWPRGVIQPVAGLFVAPTGNSVALWDCNRLGRPYVALGRFGATHRRGVGRSTQSDQ